MDAFLDAADAAAVAAVGVAVVAAFSQQISIHFHFLHSFIGKWLKCGQRQGNTHTYILLYVSI